MPLFVDSAASVGAFAAAASTTGVVAGDGSGAL